MGRQAVTLEKANASSDHQITSREEWLITRHDLLKREMELTRLRHQLRAERRALEWAKVEKKNNVEVSKDSVTLAELSDARSTVFIKHSGYRLMGLVGGPLIMAVYLLLQLHKLPNSSLSYSLLYAVISLLFNFSSSALLKAFYLMYGRFPNPRGKGVEAEIEVRQLFELDEFGPSVDIERFREMKAGRKK